MDDAERLDLIRAYYERMNRGYYEWCQSDGKAIPPRDFINQIIDATLNNTAPADLDPNVHCVTVRRDDEQEGEGISIAVAGFGKNSRENACGIVAILNNLPWLLDKAQHQIEREQQERQPCQLRDSFITHEGRC